VEILNDRSVFLPFGNGSRAPVIPPVLRMYFAIVNRVGVIRGSVIDCVEDSQVKDDKGRGGVSVRWMHRIGRAGALLLSKTGTSRTISPTTWDLKFDSARQFDPLPRHFRACASMLRSPTAHVSEEKT
jgi:hypothetical protein